MRALTKAQLNLAKMYLTARGVAFDVGQAQSWLRKAAAKGDERSSKLLADIEARPPTTPKNRQTAALGKTAPKNQGGRKMPPRLPPKAAVRNGRPAIIDAALRGQDDALQQLISAGASTTVSDEDGNTPLALASAAGKIAALDVLISTDPYLDARNKAGETALMLAAARGHADIVDRLMAKGADPSVKAEDGTTALMLAVRGCHEKVLSSLVNGKADTNASLPDGRTALMLAATACSAASHSLVAFQRHSRRRHR